MRHIDPDLLSSVTGGAHKVTRRVSDDTTLPAVTELKRTIDSFVTQSKNAPQSNALSSMLPMMMMNRG